jgi:hypothetical protein
MANEGKIMAFKLNLKNYKMPGSKQEYDVKGSLANLLFHPGQELTVDETFENYEIVKRVREAGDSLILDKDDMRRVRRAYAAMRSPSEDDLEFFHRLKTPEEIEVAEVKKP